MGCWFVAVEVAVGVLLVVEVGPWARRRGLLFLSLERGLGVGDFVGLSLGWRLEEGLLVLDVALAGCGG